MAFWTEKLKGAFVKGACYKTSPLGVENGISIFSNKDKYIENYEKIAEDHIKSLHASNINPFMEEELWVTLERSTRDLITKYITPGGKILDVGVGLGRVMEPLTQFERYGIDISLEYLEVAKAKGINVAMSKIEDMPYHDNFFDAVVVTDVLEHVFDLNKCCENIIKVLKPGGVLIVRVPYKEDLNPYLDEALPYEFVHVRSFDEASLKILFTKIFKLKFAEIATVAPYLQGTSRLKVRLLPKVVLEKIRETAAGRFSLASLMSVANLSAETFEYYLYELQSKHPEDFKLIAEDLIYGMDINAVFHKV